MRICVRATLRSPWSADVAALFEAALETAESVWALPMLTRVRASASPPTAVCEAVRLSGPLVVCACSVLACAVDMALAFVTLPPCERGVGEGRAGIGLFGFGVEAAIHVGAGDGVAGGGGDCGGRACAVTGDDVDVGDDVAPVELAVERGRRGGLREGGRGEDGGEAGGGCEAGDQRHLGCLSLRIRTCGRGGRP